MTAPEENEVDEQKYIEELRKRFKGKISEELYNDLNMFKRFILARDYNLNAAEEMLKKHISWRKVMDLEHMLDDYEPPEVACYASINRIGFDRDGHPVIYCNFGNVDTRGLLKCVRKSEVTKFMTYTFESDVVKMKEQSLKLGKTVDTFTFIFNFENFSIINATHKPTIETLAQFITMYNDNYPERLKTAYIINVSLSFTIFWAVIKNFVTGRTFKKVKVFGKDGWKEELVKAIDPEVLPMFLGGARTDPDGNPLCKTFVRHGGKVPERYYAYRKSLCVGLLNPKKLIVPRRSKAELAVEVLYPGSHIEWDFETKSRDIAFSLLYKENQNPGSKVKEILPKQRIEADVSTESKLFKCDHSGIYILQFDNSYSWVHQKEVYYKVTVSNPADKTSENKE